MPSNLSSAGVHGRGIGEAALAISDEIKLVCSDWANRFPVCRPKSRMDDGDHMALAIKSEQQAIDLSPSANNTAAHPLSAVENWFLKSKRSRQAKNDLPACGFMGLLGLN